LGESLWEPRAEVKHGLDAARRVGQMQMTHPAFEGGDNMTAVPEAGTSRKEALVGIAVDRTTEFRLQEERQSFVAADPRGAAFRRPVGVLPRPEPLSRR